VKSRIGTELVVLQFSGQVSVLELTELIRTGVTMSQQKPPGNFSLPFKILPQNVVLGRVIWVIQLFWPHDPIETVTTPFGQVNIIFTVG
jgi:hypothetical protein